MRILRWNTGNRWSYWSYIYIWIFFFIITICLISNLKLIEVLSLADGKIIPQGRIKFVQHLEGGIVEEILIKEGEKVEVNQPLVILSKEKASSEFEKEIQSAMNEPEISTPSKETIQANSIEKEPSTQLEDEAKKPPEDL